MSDSRKVPAQWTDDCQGKKDYDGHLVSLSTRYWPRGGGFLLLRADGGIEDNDARPEVRPSANATVYLGSTEDDYLDDAVVLAKQDFEADTQEEVQRQVEEWAAKQYGRIAEALLREFTA